MKLILAVTAGLNYHFNAVLHFTGECTESSCPECNIFFEMLNVLFESKNPNKRSERRKAIICFTYFNFFADNSLLMILTQLSILLSYRIKEYHSYQDSSRFRSPR